MSYVRRYFAWALLLVAVGIGFSRLTFDPEVLSLLPADEPTVQGLKKYQDHFTNARELIITVRSQDPEKAEAAARTIAERLETATNLIASVAWQPPWMERPGELAEMLACIWLNQPPEEFRSLSNRLAADNLNPILEETKLALANSLSPMDMARRSFDPFDLLAPPASASFAATSFEQGDRMFSSEDGTYRLVFAESRHDLPDYKACAEWVDSIKALIQEPKDASSVLEGVTVRYTGRPVFVSEISSSMRKDLGGSVSGTALIIAVLSWIAHRRLLPLIWVLTLLALVLGATLALGGLVFGGVKIISMAFAAILLGLADDYALVLYHEALARPDAPLSEVRRAAGPGIVWSAVTGVCAFLTLNLGGLPGLSQLGTLVAIGVALAAWVMIVWYLPLLFPGRSKSARSAPSSVEPPASIPAPTEATMEANTPASGSWKAGLATLCVLLVAGGVLLWKRPGIDGTTKALQLRNSEAQAAFDEMALELGIPKDALWLIISGPDEQVVGARLAAAQSLLGDASGNNVIRGQMLPAAIWPQIPNQMSNRATAAWLAAQGPRLHSAAQRAGFSADAMMMTDELLRSWGRASAENGVVWPTNATSKWILQRAVSKDQKGFHVMGLVYPGTNGVSDIALKDLCADLAKQGVLVSGWSLLGSATFEHVRSRAWLVTVPMIILVLVSLWLAFKRSLEVILGFAVLALSGVVLLAVMALAGWSWNLLNLMAMPLILGTGIDYSIHMQLAMRRNNGNAAEARRSIGKALWVCGATTIAGFGSLAWSSNAGIASLGQLCAAGICANMLISIILLPSWWTAFSKRKGLQRSGDQPEAASRPGPSVLYQAALWRAGLAIVRYLPVAFLKPIFLLAGSAYHMMNPSRREIVIGNLLPVFNGNRELAARCARSLFREFGLKLLSLWRFEAGECPHNWFTAGEDWGHLEKACRRGKGVLLLTPHLGNWELGGALLAHRGFKLVVLTQAEPSPVFTEMRKRARAQWGIETFVVGGGGFDFIEVIKRLQAGDNIALLIDRPPLARSVPTTLFGREFPASIAAAELARVTGCALVGAIIVREENGYAARILEEFQYDRRALSNREARIALTASIVRSFEPEIARHPEQWFHFVPVWPDPSQKGQEASNAPNQSRLETGAPRSGASTS